MNFSVAQHITLTDRHGHALMVCELPRGIDRDEVTRLHHQILTRPLYQQRSPLVSKKPPGGATGTFSINTNASWNLVQSGWTEWAAEVDHDALPVRTFGRGNRFINM
jgi:hypothetical protein